LHSLVSLVIICPAAQTKFNDTARNAKAAKFQGASKL
jgi:hypothetical protein